MKELTRDPFIFTPGSMPFDSCHASNIALLADGTLTAVWFAGTREGADDVAIWQSFFDGFRWQTPEIVAKDEEAAHWNPVLFQYGGNLLLFYKVGMQIPSWHTHVKDLNNGTVREIDNMGPVRTKICIASDGRLLAGASTEDGPWVSYCDTSEDDGQTWTRSAGLYLTEGGSPVMEARRSLIQPAIWESEMGVYHMLMRSTEGWLYRSDSSDGRTWSTPERTQIPNNNSGFDIVNLGLGRMVLCCNPVSENWGSRTPLVLMTSEDNGKTFTTAFTLEDKPGEYSYPSLLYNEGKLYVSYTYNRETIVCRTFAL